MDKAELDELAEIDIWDLDIIQSQVGEDEEDPSDKCNRLLGEAEAKFREASDGFQGYNMIGTGVREASDGFRLLAEAVKVLREEL